MMSVIENTPPSPVRRRQKSNFERSPFLSERKRTLFPSTSPHGSDLSEITPLSPVSEEFSPSKSKVVVRTPLVPTSANQNVTPKKSKNPSLQESPRRSPRLAEKQVIKTSSFYGRSLLSEFSKTTPVNSSLKTNLFQDDKKQAVKRPPPEPLQSNPSKKKCTSKQSRHSSLFSGVGHAIRRHRQPPQKFTNKKLPPLRQSLKNTFDFTKTPYSVKKEDFKWNDAHIHRERQPLEENSDEAKKRKFFKSNVKQISVITPPSSKKKCKLFKAKCDEILADPQMTASDLLDLIEGTAPSKVSANLSDLTESASNLSIDDAVEEAESSPMRELLLLDTPKTPGPDPESEFEATPESESEPAPKVYPVFNFKKNTPKSSSPRKLGSANKGPRKVWHGVGENQLLIDAGQKQFGTTQCAECGLMYEPGNAEDEIQHAEYHSNFKTLRYPGYKNERVVGRYGLDTIVCFTGSDSKANATKIQSVLAIVDAELGFDALTLKLTSRSQVYLYIADKRIVGCLVAEPLSTAYKIGNEGDVNVCSTETYSVKCGISRIWTCATYRRQGIATKLMDCVRRNFFYGSILAQESIAFSVPSVDGKKFASRYTGKQDYFVYTGWKH